MHLLPFSASEEVFWSSWWFFFRAYFGEMLRIECGFVTFQYALRLKYVQKYVLITYFEVSDTYWVVNTYFWRFLGLENALYVESYVLWYVFVK